MDFLNSLVLTYAFVMFAFGLAFIYQALSNWLRLQVKLKAQNKVETFFPQSPITKTYRLVRVSGGEKKRRIS